MIYHFGTDGIRGRVGHNLNIDLAFKIGKYLGNHFVNKDIVIGKDTRISSDVLESALCSGIASTGANVYKVGYCSTPTIPYLIHKTGYCCGIMISASHNPFYDNGIKIFDNKGKKISPLLEKSIEEYINGSTDNIPFSSDDSLGRIYEDSSLLKSYKQHVVSMFANKVGKFNVLLDTANGSASYTALDIFKALDINVDILHNEPDGININNGCGSTHIEFLQTKMKDSRYDIGFSYDGDADRIIAVNNDGVIIDGDYILYIISKYLKDINKLNNNKLVTTVMANIGLQIALKQNDIECEFTPVGDKYVYEVIENDNLSLGGEQSGHIICPIYNLSGDGVVISLVILSIMSHYNKPINELIKDFKKFPQALVNVKVKDKNIVLNDKDILAKINQIESELGEVGRILVRPSGTEPLIRVMVESETEEKCNELVHVIIDMIKEKNY